MTVIDTYLEHATPDKRAMVEHIRALAHTTIPDLEECLSYGMPGFRHVPTGKVVLGIAVNKKTIGVYPHSGSVLDKMTADISKYRTTLSALNFTSGEPLPDAVLKELLQVRLLEVLEGYGTGGKK